MDEPQLARDMGCRGRLAIVHGYSQQVMLDAVEAVYAGLLNGRTAAVPPQRS
jgi:hypothetical protein